jgi:hypothetical protein
MSTIRKLFLFAVIFSICSQFSQAQEIPNAPNPKTEYKGNNTDDPNDVSGLPAPNEYSPEAVQIMNQIKTLREQNNPAMRNLINDLNAQLNTLTQNEVTMTPDPDVVLQRPPETNPPFQTDAVGNVLVHAINSSNNYGIATATEQRGSTAGRIWVALGVRGTGADTVRYYRSDNDGATWVLHGFFTLIGRTIDRDALDMEIIENTTGEKYIYVSYSYVASGNQDVGLLVLQSPTFGGVGVTLAWPGVAATQYYDLRITSDNAIYTSNAYLYLVASVDSTAGANHIATQKTARITNPYQTTITFSYRPERLWWNSSALYAQTLQSDIAYFQNGSDSIIVSFSGVRDSTSLFFSKADISGSVGNPAGAGAFVGGSSANDEKEYARLSTNGNGNGSVICVFRQRTGNWNVKYFRTTNFGNFNTIAGQSTLWGSSTTNYQPDIVGVRNTNRHYFAFSNGGDSVHYVAVTAGGGTNHYQKLNAIFSSGIQGPKPGFRYTSGDSCFVVYTETGPSDVWVANGCTGAIVGIHNNQTPVNYSLSQNYPNPFNPSTSIKFEIPKDGLVKVVVYDILGKEVATLVNDKRAAGSYIIDFNAAGLSSGVYFYKLIANEFTDIKKMTLIK